MVFCFLMPSVVSITDYPFLGRMLTSPASWACLFASEEIEALKTVSISASVADFISVALGVGTSSLRGWQHLYSPRNIMKSPQW